MTCLKSRPPCLKPTMSCWQSSINLDFRHCSLDLWQGCLDVRQGGLDFQQIGLDFLQGDLDFKPDRKITKSSLAAAQKMAANFWTKIKAIPTQVISEKKVYNRITLWSSWQYLLFGAHIQNNLYSWQGSHWSPALPVSRLWQPLRRPRGRQGSYQEINNYPEL